MEAQNGYRRSLTGGSEHLRLTLVSADVSRNTSCSSLPDSGWIDINLTVTPMTISLLFSLLSDPSLPIRLATSVALLRMVSKGLKEPGDKVQLFKVLSLGQVLEVLEGKTRQEQAARGDDTDEGEESYRESLGRLLNTYGLELVKLNEDVRIARLQYTP